jgi:hypothetical protein
VSVTLAKGASDEKASTVTPPTVAVEPEMAVPQAASAKLIDAADALIDAAARATAAASFENVRTFMMKSSEWVD